MYLAILPIHELVTGIRRRGYDRDHWLRLLRP
jgi:hypothetical protein